MYSLLLMTAVAGSPDAAGFGWRSGGCYGGGYASCYGCSGYSSGYGCTGYSSCNGCSGFTNYLGCTGGYGSFLGLGILDRCRARKAAHYAGCSGSCHGGYAGGCWGSCYGSGYGSGCWGSCYGSGMGSGCWGSCYGSGMGTGCWGSGFGCSGGYGCSGFGVPGGAAPAINPIPTVSAAPDAGQPAAATPASLAPARLTIELPDAAKLYVDGSLVSGAGTNRLFHTPDLPPGQAFYYELKAEVEVNGKVEVEEKRVVVRSGDAINAGFPKLIAAVAAADGKAVASK